jgi:hypothetical protein
LLPLIFRRKMDKAKASPRPLQHDNEIGLSSTSSRGSRKSRLFVADDNTTPPPSQQHHHACRNSRRFAISMLPFFLYFTVSFFNATFNTTTITMQQQQESASAVSTKPISTNPHQFPSQAMTGSKQKQQQQHLPHDEFHATVRNVTESDIAQFFGHYENNNQSILGRNNSMMPVPQISLQHHSNPKLVLAHVPRSGMSLLISLWRVLERAVPWTNENNTTTSPIGVGSVANCWDVSAASILAETVSWINDRGSPAEGRHCALIWQNKTQAVTTALLRNNHDLQIVAGQVPYLGRPEETTSGALMLPSIQYMIMVRDPKLRVLSDIAAYRLDRSLSKNRTNNNARWLAEQCLQYIRSELSQGRFAGGALMTSLITPYQKAFVQYYRLYWTYERRVHLAIKNMERSDGRILFGSLDHLNETLDLLSYMVPEIPVSLISYFQRTFASSSKTTQKAWNIWQTLSPSERELLQMYCTWEQQIYDVAVSLHTEQLGFVRQKPVV